MPVKKKLSGRNEQGVVITLVAVFMLFVIGAMAALSIDVATLYTARSEAQLAADSAALAGARVLANSGATSDTTGASMPSAWNLATAVALQVAEQNQVGGAYLAASQVTLPPLTANDTDPTFTVKVQVNLPTFFARIWGRTQVTVAASATAEAYNPSGSAALASSKTATPVAPLCVKPWLLPNMDPTNGTPAGLQIFDPATGAIKQNLVGQGWPNASPPTPNSNGLFAVCGNCSSGPLPSPLPGEYYPAAIDGPAPDFPHPTQALPACSAGFNNYQLAIAGCVQQPISCGVNSATNPSAINIDTSVYVASTGSRDSDTVQAAKCLTHYNAPTDADSIDNSVVPGPPYQPPFQFLGGNQNPVAGAVNQPVLVSDSIVTIPVIDVAGGAPPTTVTVIGFLQVFLNPQSVQLPIPAPPAPTGSYQIPVTIINMAGCGNTATGNPILGNGASPVAVRLISPP